eukprot:m.317537 g.317537  ORF g.317537 m.317537 type:complete len:471 (+) comp16509_c1_seq6:2973-4385(+)
MKDLDLTTLNQNQQSYKAGEELKLRCRPGYNQELVTATCYSPSFVVSDYNGCTKVEQQKWWTPTKIGLVAGAMVVVVFMLLLLWIRFQSDVNYYKNENIEIDRLLESEVKINTQNRESWRILWETIKLGDVLGQGASGVVYKGTWMDGEVAIKFSELADREALVATQFMEEAETMAKLRHPNIIQFYGAGESPDHKPFIVMEVMDRGTLYDLLQTSFKDLDWVKKLKFCKEISAGMAYLHDKNIIHRDLKSENVLIDSTFSAKVADFGCLKLMQQIQEAKISKRRTSRPKNRLGRGRYESRKHRALYTNQPDDSQELLLGGESVRESVVSAASYSSVSEWEAVTIDPTPKLDMHGKKIFATNGIGTLNFMAPEVLAGRHGRAQYGLTVDVYSYGMVMYEIASGDLPFSHIDDALRFEQLVLSGERPTIPLVLQQKIPQGYVDLMCECWDETADVRPSFVKISEQLTTMKA